MPNQASWPPMIEPSQAAQSGLHRPIRSPEDRWSASAVRQEHPPRPSLRHQVPLPAHPPPFAGRIRPHPPPPGQKAAGGSQPHRSSSVSDRHSQASSPHERPADVELRPAGRLSPECALAPRSPSIAIPKCPSPSSRLLSPRCNARPTLAVVPADLPSYQPYASSEPVHRASVLNLDPQGSGRGSA